MKKTIYFVRHGQTDYNKKHIVQGSGVDADLNEEGKTQGVAFYHHYKDVSFGLVLTSALKRTHQTVQSFIDDGLPWEQHADINEISWGIHEGAKGTPEMRDNYLALNAQWNAGNYDARIEAGESAAELGERVGRFMEMLKKRTEENILVCTHGRTMCAVSCFLADLALKEMHQFKHKNTALTLTRFESNSFKIILKNDTSHLQL